MGNDLVACRFRYIRSLQDLILVIRKTKFTVHRYFVPFGPQPKRTCHTELGTTIFPAVLDTVTEIQAYYFLPATSLLKLLLAVEGSKVMQLHSIWSSPDSASY